MTQQTQNTVTLTRASRDNIAQSAKALSDLASVAGFTLHIVENFFGNSRIFEVYGKGKQAKGKEAEQFHMAFNAIVGNDQLGQFLISKAYANLGTIAQRALTAFQRTNTHTIVSGGNVAKIQEQIELLALYAELFGLNVDGTSKEAKEDTEPLTEPASIAIDTANKEALKSVKATKASK